MHHPQDQDQWIKSLQQHAARMAFPDWESGPADWAHLYTGFDDGARYTEVAVYRTGDDGTHVRIYYRRYTGDELTAFWARLLNEIAK